MCDIITIGVNMIVKVFSSGSSGNSTIIITKTAKILIDVGISKKQIVSGLESVNLCVDDLDAILITHEHTDHIKSFDTFLCLNVPIYLNYGTYNYILNSYKNSIKKCDDKSKKAEKLLNIFNKRFNEGTIIIMERTKDSILYNSFRINHSIITPLPLFHDASETSGFLIEDESERLVYITDTGYIHESLYDMISNANIYILESNHDPEILMTSNRPYPTKIRILSDHGHMSNEESMVTLANIMGSDTKYVLHAHVSQECNLSEIIELTRKKVFKAYNVDTSNKTFVILHPYPSEVFEI